LTTYSLPSTCLTGFFWNTGTTACVACGGTAGCSTCQPGYGWGTGGTYLGCSWPPANPTSCSAGYAWSGLLVTSPATNDCAANAGCNNCAAGWCFFLTATTV